MQMRMDWVMFSLMKLFGFPLLFLHGAHLFLCFRSKISQRSQPEAKYSCKDVCSQKGLEFPGASGLGYQEKP